MSIKIGNNFSYLGKKFLDNRQSFNTLEEMNLCNDVPEGFITYCKEDKKRYEFKDGVWVEYNKDIPMKLSQLENDTNYVTKDELEIRLQELQNTQISLTSIFDEEVNKE